MRRYATGLFVFSILMILFGFITEKITISSFQYISLPGVIFAVGKSLLVVLILLFAIGAAIPSLFIDILLTFFTDLKFPLLNFLKEICWDKMAVSWFWNDTSGSSVFFGALILLLISGALSRKRVAS